NNLQPPAATFHLDFATSATQFAPKDELFQNVFVGFSTLGVTFTATAANDSKFTAVAQRLTDGLNGWLPVSYTGPNKNQYFSQVPSGNGCDLHGFEIVAITERLNSYTYMQPGSDPNHNGQWTDYQYDATFTILGHLVPEPSGIALAAGAWLLVVGWCLAS